MTERELNALQIVNRHSLISGGIGLIPLPVVDMVGTMAVQVHMLSDLSKHYDMPFAANRVKQSLTGHGHASKGAMQKAIQVQWRLAEPPEPPDVADALAVALCCARSGAIADLLTSPVQSA